MLYILSGLPSPLLKNVFPYECLTGNSLAYTQLKMFGCLCYASTLGLFVSSPLLPAAVFKIIRQRRQKKNRNES